MSEAYPVRLLRLRSIWSAIATSLATPAVASFVYGLATARGAVGRLPLLALIFVPTAGGIGSAVVLSVARRLHPGRLKPAPAEAGFGSGLWSLSAVVAACLLIGGFLIARMAELGPTRSADMIGEAGLLAGIATGIAAGCIAVRHRELADHRTFWLEAPRLTGWYDVWALYCTGDGAAHVDEGPAELEALKLVRARDELAMVARTMTLSTVLGLTYGLVAAGGSRHLWPLPASFAGVAGSLTLVMYGFARYSERTNATPRVAAPPDADHQAVSATNSPALPVLVGFVVLLGLLALTGPDVGFVGSVSGLAGGFMVPARLAARRFAAKEHAAGLAFWRPPTSWSGTRASSRRVGRGGVPRSTPRPWSDLRTPAGVSRGEASRAQALATLGSTCG